MVSSAHPIATAAGLAILRAGGNAFDAAVAVATTLTVVEPYNSGIGGYGLLLVYDASAKRARVLNMSGRIPRGADPAAFRPPAPEYRANRTGAKAVSTPVNALGWETLWKEYGKRPWADLLSAAIEAASNGFVVSEKTAETIRSAYGSFPEHAKAIYGRDGQPLRPGDRLVQEDLAGSLRALARDGARAVHGGALGHAIEAEIRAAHGFLALADLESAQAEWYEAVGIDFRGYRVISAPPPANSFTSLLRLGLMSQFDNRASGHNSVSYLHRFAEVTKHAEWVRLTYAADPDVGRPPLERLLSAAYWKEEAARIDPRRARPFSSAGVATAEGRDTTHFVVADSRGNVVCQTQTLGEVFGSKVLVRGTGIWLNNSLAYSTFEPPGNPMDVHPGRRKLISNHPTLVLRDGQPWIAIGTPGGHTIGQTVPQMILNMVEFGMDVQQAIAAPRLSFDAETQVLSVEAGIPEESRAALERMGHTVRVARALGNAHGLEIEYDRAGAPARFRGGADPRGQGTAAGY